jgi:colicin import membrane protein
MRGPTLQKTTLVSFALHLTLLVIVIISYRQTHRLIIPPYYTVNLVNTDIVPSKTEGPKMDVIKNDNVPAAKPVVQKQKKTAKKEKVKMDIKHQASDTKRVEQKIAALATKKKRERISRMRSVISLKAKSGNHGNSVQASGQGTEKSFSGYYARITQEIHQQWIWPEKGPRNIEAIITIRIFKDGTAKVQKIEKSSGNALFDRSALKALAKASPLTPPPYELEIGVRFYP